MRSDEIVELASNQLVEIGGHSVHHESFLGMTEAEQRQDIRKCRQTLQNLLARPITSFSYPFGTKADWDKKTSALVASEGFTCACTASIDLTRATTNPFAISRLWVNDWPADQFAARLKRWLH